VSLDQQAHLQLNLVQLDRKAYREFKAYRVYKEMLDQLEVAAQLARPAQLETLDRQDRLVRQSQARLVKLAQRVRIQLLLDLLAQ
jgi:hypothetical protein